MQETGGELVLTPPAGSTGYAAYLTDDDYDLCTYAITVEMVSPTNPVPYAECSMEVKDRSSDDVAGLGLQEGMLVLFTFLNMVGTEVASVTFDAQTHRYWRLRSLGGYFFADTSPDGIVWTNLGSVSDPFPMDRVHLALKAGTWAVAANPGAAHFDNFNLLP
jgi:hypothetical protein